MACIVIICHSLHISAIMSIQYLLNVCPFIVLYASGSIHHATVAVKYRGDLQMGSSYTYE